jgi:beta-glucosidase
MGVACITGFQGSGPAVDDHHVMATMKHFAVHGQPQGGLNQGPGNFSERVVRGEFLVPFRAAVTEAGVMSVMPSYNEVDGVPSHINRWLLQEVLREEWGFPGLVVSDYSGISQLFNTNFVARDREEAARKSLDAGVDVDLPNGDTFGTLPEQVRNGKVSEATLDRAVARVLRAKFLLGLFERPYVDPDYAARITNPPEHRALALRAAHRVITLLKNDGNLLPLDRTKIKRLAVIGPNAADVHLGGYSWEPREGVSVLEGIKSKAGKSIEIRYAEGCRITENIPSWFQDEVKPADPAVNARLIREAVKTVKSCDAVLLCIGENESTCREAWAKNHLGDRNTLDLPGQQNELVHAIVETGVPVVVLLFNGRPLSINYVAEHVPAILEGWYLGQEGGTAVADVLFGEVNPGGKLPITFPRSAGHLPVYYYQKPTVGVDYLFDTREPLFPFGWGLSYTAFRYDNLRVSPETIGPAGKATVSVDVSNTGKVTGDEVVQLYIRDLVGSVTRPVKELKGFERITLKPGEKRTVTFEITPEKLSFYTNRMEWAVEPGEFSLMVGGNSRDVQTVKLEVAER